MNHRSLFKLQGWRLLAVVSLLLSVMAAFLVAVSPDVAGIRMVIRWTARTSLLLFLLTFTASAAWRRWPGPWTRWQLTNRRYVGLSFAFSHGVHLLAILAFAHLAPVELDLASNPSTRFVGELGYVFIIAMTATSFDTTAAWLGLRAWKVLHTTGSWYLWLVFLSSYLSRAVHQPQYWVGVAVVLGALAVRTVPVRGLIAPSFPPSSLPGVPDTRKDCRVGFIQHEPQRETPSKPSQ